MKRLLNPLKVVKFAGIGVTGIVGFLFLWLLLTLLLFPFGFFLGLFLAFAIPYWLYYDARINPIQDGMCSFCGFALKFRAKDTGVTCSSCRKRNVVRNNKLYTPDEAKSLFPY